MSSPAVADSAPQGVRAWKGVVEPYQQPDVRRAILQLVTTLALLGAALWLMYYSLRLPYVVTLLLALPTAGLLVRTFIFMHDCAHGSFLPSRRANDIIGFITGVLTLTPFAQWRRDHALHHASAGDLDRRGHGDVPTLTVREYLARSRWGRLRYRLFRHPAVFFVLAPLQMLIGQRFPPRGGAAGSIQTKSIWGTNAAILVLAAGATALVGVRAVLLVYLPMYYIAASIGVWLFFVQHQFEGTYWEEHERWDYATAAIAGSSHLRLPAVLQWFTGNIGLHHVHHLGPRIPNYNLQRCHDENALLHRATVVTLRQSVTAFRLALWDEERRRLVRFADVRAQSDPPPLPAR